LIVLEALKRGKSYEISNILLLESEEDIKERKETLFFLLGFLLEIRVKASSLASIISIVTSILEENIRARPKL